MANLTNGQIQSLWISLGGSPAAAPTAAAIALAESGGNPNASHTNSNGSIDRGLFQINSVHGASQSTFDLNANVRAAIAISNNGKNWSPWSTFTSGAFRRFLTGPQSAGTPAGGAPGSGPGNPFSAITDAFKGIADAIISGIKDILAPIIDKLAGVFEVAGGGFLMISGITIIVLNTKGGKAVAKTGSAVIGKKSLIGKALK